MPFAPLSLIRVGVVGVGSFGQHHARIYAGLPGCRLVAVADPDPERARKGAFQAGARALTDYREMVGLVEAASVAVPTVLHAEVAVHLLENGVDVLIEKPLAATLAEADAILDAAARGGGRIVGVGHAERFNPAVRALLDRVVEPRFLEVHRLASFSPRSTDVDVCLDLMVHDLDIALAMARRPIRDIQAVGVAVLTDKVDIGNARIVFEGGCVANLTASRVSAEKVRKVRVFQRDAYISIDTGEQTGEEFRLVREEGMPPRIERSMLPIEKGEPLRHELEAFLAACRTRSAPPVTGEDGRRALEAALRIREAMEESLR